MVIEAWQWVAGSILAVLGIAETARWRVTSRIDRMRTELTKRSDAMDAKAEARTEALRSDLSGRMDRMEDRLMAAIRDDRRGSKR